MLGVKKAQRQIRRRDCGLPTPAGRMLTGGCCAPFVACIGAGDAPGVPGGLMKAMGLPSLPTSTFMLGSCSEFTGHITICALLLSVEF